MKIVPEDAEILPASLCGSVMSAYHSFFAIDSRIPFWLPRSVESSWSCSFSASRPVRREENRLSLVIYHLH